jgi:antibiotic biosynthesis monooxygenase (ABM) superfamily enzyme
VHSQPPGKLYLRFFVIARHWRGWTNLQKADAYEALLEGKILPGLKAIPGYRGGYVLRSDDSEESEFIVINMFDSLESVKAFAGADHRTPVFDPEARALLSRIDPIAYHYDVRVNTV